MGLDVVVMKVKVKKVDNLFELIWVCCKFDVFGKKCKGEECCVGFFRFCVVDKRKNMLFKEYEQSLKFLVFMDKCIGEYDNEFGEFDKGVI